MLRVSAARAQESIYGAWNAPYVLLLVPKLLLDDENKTLAASRLLENSISCEFVILSEAKNLVILITSRSFTSFRMT